MGEKYTQKSSKTGPVIEKNYIQSSTPPVTEVLPATEIVLVRVVVETTEYPDHFPSGKQTITRIIPFQVPVDLTDSEVDTRVREYFGELSDTYGRVYHLYEVEIERVINLVTQL